MYSTLSSSKDIISAQKEFKSVLLSKCKIKSRVRVGFPGGSGISTVHYSPEYDFWFSSNRFDEPKFWNAFGVGLPSKHQSNSIVVEINFALSKLNRRIGGLLVTDSNGIYVAHRGKIGGGRAGIGKNLFFSFYNGSPIEIDDGGILNEVFLIGSLNSKSLPLKVSDFVHSVDHIKSKISSSRKITLSNTVKDYFPEHFGKKNSYRVSQLISQESRHGEVVDKLKSLLVAKKYKVGKDKNRDLYIHTKGRITSLFEIKTNVLNQSIYSGIGQLLLYKHKLPASCKLFLVLPARLDKSVISSLKNLNINIINYSLSSKNIRISLPANF